MSGILEHIECHGLALSQKVLDEMYRDPFWSERYGDRGRRHANEDSDFHLRYLSRALAAGDAGVLRRYATWLREVLATRGMCTRHLDENFRLLAREIGSQPWPERERAVAFLAEARDALAYEAGEARTLQERTEALADAISREFSKRRPHGWKRDDRGEDALRDDAANYLSYVADAVAFGKPDTLVTHTRWLAAHVQSRGADAASVTAFLACTREVLAASEAGAKALAYLDAAATHP
jgi:hypothetical protein